MRRRRLLPPLGMPLRATTPARHPDAVALACDTGQLAIALCVALRIDRLEPGRRFDLVIATPDWEAIRPAWRDLPVRFVEIDAACVPAFRHPKPWISVGTFYRHLLPELLRRDYARLLYLDTDVYLRRPGIGGLLDRATGDWPIAAALDRIHLKPGRKLRRPATAALLDDFGGARRRFFQAGVLLLQTGPHAAQGLGPRILRFADEGAAVLHRHRFGDQGALNAVAADAIEPLSPLWNWTGRPWLRPRVLARFDPHLLHFTGPGKPWTLQDDPFIATLNEEYFDCLARLDPGFRPRPARLSLPWRAANPQHRIAVVERLGLALRRFRHARRLPREEAASLRNAAAMERMIAEARVG